MLFVLDESLCNYAPSDVLPESVATGLDVIALGFREGRHILAGPPQTLISLINRQNLQPLTKAALRVSRDRFPELMALPGRYATFVNLVADPINPASRKQRNETNIIEIPISHFSNSAKVQNVVILAENLLDAEIAKLMGVFYRSEESLNSLPLRCEPRCGAGTNLGPTIVQLAAENERFCVVIVDSDKKSPDGAFGDTIKFVRKKWKETGPSPLIEFCALDCKEMENALPDSFYEAAYANDLTHRDGAVFLRNLSVMGLEELRDFVDIKEGLSIANVYGLPRNSPDFKFWSSNLRFLAKASPLSSEHDPSCVRAESCQRKAQCLCWILKPNGTDILAKAAQRLSGWKKPHWRGLTGRRRDVWLKVGRIVFEWSSGWEFSAS